MASTNVRFKAVVLLLLMIHSILLLPIFVLFVGPCSVNAVLSILSGFAVISLKKRCFSCAIDGVWLSNGISNRYQLGHSNFYFVVIIYR